MSTHSTTTGRSVNRLVALVFGIVYTLVGLLGFLVTSGVPFAATEGDLLLGFEVNPLHNIAHLLIGVLLIVASRTVSAARSANIAVGAVYLLLGIAGLFVIGTDLNILALNTADNFLHFATAILLLGVGLSQDKPATRRA